MSCAIVLVGVGGQGVLAVADLLARAAVAGGLDASFCPTKGMAQRGGFVMGEVRLGANGGMRIPPRGAEIVVAMERSEALKGIGYVRQDGAFLLYDDLLLPPGVLLGRDRYPARGEVIAAIEGAAGRIVVLDPSDRPEFSGGPVPANIYVLGAASGIEPLSSLIAPATLEGAIEERWPRAAEANLAAFRAGRGAV